MSPTVKDAEWKLLEGPKNVAEDDFTSNIPQKHLKKRTDSAQEQHKGEGCQHLNVEPSA